MSGILEKIKNYTTNNTFLTCVFLSFCQRPTATLSYMCFLITWTVRGSTHCLFLFFANMNSTNSYNIVISYTKCIFLYRASSIGGGTSCPIHRNGATARPAYTLAKNAKKGGVTLKLCINHKGNFCENSDHLQLYKKWKGKRYCVAKAYIQILFSGK